MSKIEQGGIPICVLEGLHILSRRDGNGQIGHRVIMTFIDTTQQLDLFTDEGYQTLAGPFPHLSQAEEVRKQLGRKIAELGVDKVVKEIIKGSV